MFKKLLMATDLTPTSRSALELAANLARSSAGTLFVLHVDEMPDSAKRWLTPFYSDELTALRGFVDRHAEAVRQHLMVQLRQVLGPQPDIAVEPIFRWGRPPETIVAEAERLGADVIVMGTRGTPLGSVSEVVTRSAGRPVLVVPAGGVLPATRALQDLPQATPREAVQAA